MPGFDWAWAGHGAWPFSELGHGAGGRASHFGVDVFVHLPPVFTRQGLTNTATWVWPRAVGKGGAQSLKGSSRENEG